MAIEEEIYTKFELSEGVECQIEKTHRGHIHVHIGDILLSFEQDEFIDCAETIVKGKNELRELKSYE